ncbi:MAG: ABC transporter ATP-binding protein [Candidatus Berkelbacteria bacterium]|nr:ABC transporter ATP-binding protein [Candidatus Berkelbacteria bacterium]
MSAISVKNLVKKFGDFKAVDDLSFEITEKRVLGFLGPNGAGKTTTIRLLVGLSRLESGEISICGEPVIFGQSKTNRLIGYLPEQPAFYTWMTASEYLSFAARASGVTDGLDQRIKKVLHEVDLTEACDKRIGTFSNGMKQRLGIAQAIIHKPKVLIMDEPVSALDPIGRREVLSIIQNLKKEMTILLSTHILSDVDRICDDIAIINKGKLIALSPLSELKEKYAKPLLDVEFGSSPAQIVEDLKKEPWVDHLELNGNSMKIWPGSNKAIENNLPLRFFTASKIPVLKYGLVLPEMEDLFISLIEKENK